MADREKVIKGLKACSRKNWACNECPYGDATLSLSECHDVMLMDALELLNEHRCKSCLYCELSADRKWCLMHNVSPYICRHLHMYELDLNWFCADWTARPESKRNGTGQDEGCSADGGLMPAT